MTEVGDVLRDVLGDQLDETTIEYLNDVLLGEVGLLPKGARLTSQVIEEVLGPFIEEHIPSCTPQVFESLAQRLASSSLESDEGSGEAVDANRLEEPYGDIQLKDVFDKSCVGGFEDPMLGITRGNVNFNSSVPIAEAIKLHKAIQKEKDAALRKMKQWEKEKLPLPPPCRRHGDVQLAKVTDVSVDSFAISVGGRELLKEAALRITIGRHYGLVGRNGIGKSTLLAHMVRGEIPGIPKDTSIGCIEQEIIGNEKTALEAVLEVDAERTELLLAETRLMAESEKSNDEASGKELAKVYNRLQQIEAADAPAKASTILSGLGFSTAFQNTPTKNMSGGWRMRVALARALFSDPDVLCLDEPTNHLDLNAVAWLTEFIQQWDKTCIIVSHSRSFLNHTCTDIIEFADFRLVYYCGNYDVFEKLRCDKMNLQQKQFETQQKKRAHMQGFIDRFRYNANRAALVQSRIKALEKLPMLEAVANDPHHVFTFTEPEALPTPILVLQDASFSYNGQNVILKDVSLNVDLTTRMAICGVNGSGKSTLLKLLVGENEVTSGTLSRNARLRIGYFNQHHVDGLDLTLNATQQLQLRYPEADLKPEEARTFLGKFGITGVLGLEPMFILSGGQKSRVAIALMAYSNPHILILDEPTNHLDLEAVQALISALDEFAGGLVVVSHDAHLLQCVADEVWHVDPETHSCTKFQGDFDAYCKKMLKLKI